MSVSNRPIRVLFVRPALAQGGADKVTATVLQHLDRKRFSPELALVTRTGVWLDAIPGDVTIHELGCKKVRWMVRPLIRLIRERRPDVVFSTASGTNVAAILATRASRTGARVVTSERSILLNGGYRPKIVLSTLLKALAYPFAHQLTALSAGVADDMASKLPVRRESILALYNPLVDDSTAARASEPVDHPWFNGDHPVVVAAGRFVPQKGFPVLLEAFAAVHQRLPQARLVILGEGEGRASLEAKVAKLGLGEVVSLPGFKKNPQAYFSRAKVFAMSSLNEGLGNVMVEAMSCGIPVVSTDCPVGPAEIVSHGSDGYLVPVGDHRKLAQHLIELLESPADASRMGEAARRSADRFRVSNVMKNYERAIELTAGKAAGGR